MAAIWMSVSIGFRHERIDYSKRFTLGEKFPLSQTFHINKKTAGLL